MLRTHASILTARGRKGEAEAVLTRSMALAQQFSSLAWRLRAANDLARLWLADSRADEARAMLVPVYSEFTEGFATRDLRIAAELIDARVPPLFTAHSGHRSG